MARIYTILACGGLLVGVGLGEVGAISHWGIAGYLLLGLITVGLIFYRSTRWLWPGLLFLLLVVLGNWRLGVARIIPPADVSHYAGQVVTLTGMIVNDPQVSSSDLQFILRVATADVGAKVSGRVLIKTRAYPDYQYGNSISVTGKLLVPEDITSGYGRYLSRMNIYVTCSYPEITLLKDFVGQPIWRWLYKTKHYFLRLTGQVVPEPAAGLLAGLLLGISTALPKNLLDSFNATGLTHIIALSGFNISIVSAAIVNLLRWLPVRWRWGIAILVVWLFVLLTGAAPSAVRAAIMGMLILLAGIVGRLADVTVSLGLAAALMVAGNPKILAGDVGFQLSFLATVGIIYLNPFGQQLLHRWPAILRGAIIPTLAALIMVTPILAINFGRVSLIAPLTNVLVVPLVPVAMLLGFLAMIGGMIQTDLGWLLGWLAWAPLRLVTVIAEYFQQLPGASIMVKVAPGIWLIIYYLGIIVLLAKYYVQQIKIASRAVGLTHLR